MEEEVRGKLKEFVQKKFSFQNDKLVIAQRRKRNEEYIKFVIKRGFKHLFKKYKKCHNHFILGSKLMDEEVFYEYYFLEDSKTQQIEIDNYYLPGSKIQKSRSSSKHKNLTFSYLKLIFLVEKFQKDFKDYFQNHYVKSCRKERKKKLVLLCKKFKKANSFEGLKLPWTN